MAHAVLPPTRKELVRPTACLSFADVRSRLERGLTVMVGKPLASSLALPFCAPWLVYGETVVAVDGTNCFNLYRLTEWAKRKNLDSPALLNRLRIARAFTPFQLATILHHIGSDMDRHGAMRLIVTGLPDCLYDEELSGQEARNTFARCRETLARLAQRHTVLAFTDSPAHPVGEREKFLAALIAHARPVLEVNHTEPVSFTPVKAPGLLTITRKEVPHG